MPRGARHVIAREAPFAQSDTEKTVRDDARTSSRASVVGLRTEMLAPARKEAARLARIAGRSLPMS